VGRECLTDIVAAAGFLAAAIALAVAAPWARALSPGAAVAALAIFVVAQRVRFHVSHGWTDATQLAYVPMLFLLPVPLVPLLAAATALAVRLAGCVGRRDGVPRALLALGDNWYALGPAVVLVAAGQPAFGWPHWPLYVAALGAQVGLDLASTLARAWFGERL